MPTRSLPKLMPADRAPRSGLRFFALGAAYRGVDGTDLVTLGAETPWSVEGATHVVRARNAGDAVRAYLSDRTVGSRVEKWLDDEKRQRLLFVCPVEELPFLSSWLRDNRTGEFMIETSTTHRRQNDAPIRFLRVR